VLLSMVVCCVAAGDCMCDGCDEICLWCGWLLPKWMGWMIADRCACECGDGSVDQSDPAMTCKSTPSPTAGLPT
jgi:hypothetical protein